MSIYASTWSVDADDHTDTCALWQPCYCDDPYGHSRGRIGAEGHWRYIGEVACTCNAGPIIYLGSHILPHDTQPRGGTLDLAEIPGHITRDGRSRDSCPDEDDERPWPWLRATMRAHDAEDCQDVVLDRGQVASLRDYLTNWLQRTQAEQPATCSCTHFSDTGGFRIGDLCCPVHGVDGPEPLDGPWDTEVTA